MTEKRFKLYQSEDLSEEYVCDNGIPLRTDEEVDLLNDLHEENEKLKKQFIMILIKLGKKTHVIQCNFCKHGEYYTTIETGYYHEHHFRCAKDYEHKLGLKELCPYWEINVEGIVND